MQPWYRMHDEKPNGVMPIHPSEAFSWNARGCGIFWTVNEFNGPRRIENLTRIRAWAVDLDEGSKQEQWERLQRGLIPSRIVETKRGFQAYWRAKDARPEHWNAIVLDRLVPFYGADKNARDLARILRVPGFLHLKNPSEPFKVIDAHLLDVSYSEQQMAEAYPLPEKAKLDRRAHEEQRKELKTEGSTFWDRVWALDCRAGLERLSGSGAVGGERYTFKHNRSGTWNILVDGKGTSCWVDLNGRIGSLSHGGPSLYSWLRWFKHSPKECAEILKREFPELEERRP